MHQPNRRAGALYVCGVGVIGEDCAAGDVFERVEWWVAGCGGKWGCRWTGMVRVSVRQASLTGL